MDPLNCPDPTRCHDARGRLARALLLVCVGSNVLLAACLNQDLAAAQPRGGSGSSMPGRTPDIAWQGSAESFIEPAAQTPADAGQDSTWYVYPPARHTPVEVILGRMLRANRSSLGQALSCDRGSVQSPRADSTPPLLLLGDDPGRCVVDQDSISGPDFLLRVP